MQPPKQSDFSKIVILLYKTLRTGLGSGMPLS